MRDQSSGYIFAGHWVGANALDTGRTMKGKVSTADAGVTLSVIKTKAVLERRVMVISGV
jgi:hypothetical protein